VGRAKQQYVEYASKTLTPRGVSQHEWLIHPVEHNEKRERAATHRIWGLNKGYGKVWQKEEVDIMIASRNPCRATDKFQSRWSISWVRRPNKPGTNPGSRLAKSWWSNTTRNLVTQHIRAH